jgi:uncharacterized phiE125 gp8 family phage protein
VAIKSEISIAPTTEPVTLSEVKDQVRERSTDYNSELQNLITEGRVYVEKMTGRALITQTRKAYFDDLYLTMVLPNPPLQSVSSISYQDSSNAAQTLSSSLYTVDTKSKLGKVSQAYSQSYPSVYDDYNAVTVTYVCGYGGREDVPDSFKAAIKLYVQWRFDHDDSAKEIMDILISQEKVEWLELES